MRFNYNDYISDHDSETSHNIVGNDHYKYMDKSFDTIWS